MESAIRFSQQDPDSIPTLYLLRLQLEGFCLPVLRRILQWTIIDALLEVLEVDKGLRVGEF